MRFDTTTWLMGILATLICAGSVAWASNITSDVKEAQITLPRIEAKLDAMAESLKEVKEQLKDIK